MPDLDGVYPTPCCDGTDDDLVPSVLRQHDRYDVMAWYALMVNAAQHMSPADRAELDEWDSQRPGDIGTSEWPGWRLFINMDTFWPWPRHQGHSHGQRKKAAKPPQVPKSDVPNVGFFVYRLWADNGRLVYVGSSVRLRNRLTVHRRRTGDTWTDATWEEHPDALSMLRAEAEAISAEHPALNKQLTR